MWEEKNTENKGQAKILHLKDGKLTFTIGWTGTITGTTNIADGKPHKIGLRFKKNEAKFHLLVDGKVEASGLEAVKDREEGTFQIGVSVGKDERSVGDGAPLMKAKIDDIRIGLTPDTFEAAVTK